MFWSLLKSETTFLICIAKKEHLVQPYGSVSQILTKLLKVEFGTTT